MSDQYEYMFSSPDFELLISIHRLLLTLTQTTAYRIPVHHADRAIEFPSSFARIWSLCLIAISVRV